MIGPLSLNEYIEYHAICTDLSSAGHTTRFEHANLYTHISTFLLWYTQQMIYVYEFKSLLLSDFIVPINKLNIFIIKFWMKSKFLGNVPNLHKYQITKGQKFPPNIWFSHITHLIQNLRITFAWLQVSLDQCTRQNIPPTKTKIILAKAIHNSHRFIHIYIWVSSIPSQIDKCVIWPIVFQTIENNAILFF